MTKMAEDAKLEELSKKHPAIKAAYENLKRAEEQLKTTIILSKDEQSTS
jgi:hemerythrin superfamily protein